MFQDDSAPCHRAGQVKTWMQTRKIKQLAWPGNSPDLNPIENCWSKVMKEVRAKRATSKISLMEAIIHVWNHSLDMAYIQKLVESMPDRFQAVIKARGGATKY